MQHRKDDRMDYYEKVEFLKSYYFAGLRIKGLQEEKQHWKDYGVDIAQKYSPAPASVCGDGKISKSATNTLSVEDQINIELKTAAQIRESVKNAIESVKNRRYRIVLYMHHISCMSFADIATKLDKTERNVYNVYKKAVNDLEI